MLGALAAAAWLLPLCAPPLGAALLPAAASYEFTAFRMQQYDLQRSKHGCRGARVAAEARSADDPGLARRCVVMRLPDFTLPRLLEAQRQNAAALLVLLPANVSAQSHDVIQTFMASEREALRRGSATPVYVAPEDEQLLCMYDEVKTVSAMRTSNVLVRVLRSMVTATAFQILVSNSNPINSITDTSIVTLEGVLPGAGEDPPTIVISAHYDSYGLAPWLAYGADSNGSGVTILLELVRLFHKLYSNQSTKPRYHLLFSLAGGGKYNFMGTKKWVEENMDHAESSLLHDNVALVLCLDTLANGDELYLHVSRPPKPGTALHTFIQLLEQVVSERFPGVRLALVHKKINLAESTVTWEHERYGLRGIPGVTLSHLEDPRSGLRGSILDTASQVDLRKLKRNGIIIAESLARFMFNLSDKGSAKDIQIFKGNLEIQDGRLSTLMSFLTSVPRAAQLMDRDPGQTLLVNSLEQELRHHLHHVHRHVFRQDRRDPDITFFDQMSQPMMMYRVKPAAFDLFLGGCITAYLAMVYYAIENFGFLYSKLKSAVKSKQQ